MARELNERKLYDDAIHDASPEAWADCAVQIARITSEQALSMGRSDSDIDERIPKIRDAVTAIAENPDEPVIFSYQRHIEDRTFKLFAVTIPDNATPFELVLAPRPRYAGHEYSLAVHARCKDAPNNRPLLAERQISYYATNHSAITNFVGVQTELRSPDLFYQNRDIEDKTIQSGNHAIAALFAGLHAEPTTPAHANKVFGALFQIALLSKDFELPVLHASGFLDEAVAATASLVQKCDESTSVVVNSLQHVRVVRVLLESYRLYRADLQGKQMLQAEENNAIAALLLPDLGKNRSAFHHGIPGYDTGEDHLEAFVQKMQDETAEHRRRLSLVRKWHEVLREMMLISDNEQ